MTLIINKINFPNETNYNIDQLINLVLRRSGKNREKAVKINQDLRQLYRCQSSYVYRDKN